MDYPIIHDMPQGSPEWVAIRLGIITGSKFGNALAGGSGKTRKTLMDDLIEEHLSQRPKERVITEDMARGTEREDAGRTEYIKIEGREVKQVGFIQIGELIGISPDGLVDEDRGLEIKSPKLSTHIKYMETKKWPVAYDWQMHGGMWATGRKYWDFVSYCPECVLRPYWRITIDRDEHKIAELDIKINIFADELKQRLFNILGPQF